MPSNGGAGRPRLPVQPLTRTRDAILRGLDQLVGREPVRSMFVSGKGLLSSTIFRSLPIRAGRGRLYMNPTNPVCLFPYLFGTYEWREIELVRQLVRQSDTTLDVGANIGYYTFKLSEMTGEQGMVHAFEPDPTNCGILRRNVALNSLSNVKIHNMALADFDGTSLLYRSQLNAGDYSLSPRSDSHKAAVQVACRRLDSISEQIARAPSFLKMDVQGFESAVLHGATKCLDVWQPRPSMLLEFEPDSLLQAGHSPDGLLDWLTKRNYLVGQVSRGPVRPISQAEHSTYSEWAGRGCNLVAVPEEERAVFLSLK
jgi:FkbM family methyltransferase